MCKNADLQNIKSFFADRRLFIRLFCRIQIDNRPKPVDVIYLQSSILMDMAGTGPPRLK